MAKGGTQIRITEVLVIEITCIYENRAREKQLERARNHARAAYTYCCTWEIVDNYPNIIYPHWTVTASGYSQEEF